MGPAAPYRWLSEGASGARLPLGTSQAAEETWRFPGLPRLSPGCERMVVRRSSTRSVHPAPEVPTEALPLPDPLAMERSAGILRARRRVRPENLGRSHLKTSPDAEHMRHHSRDHRRRPKANTPARTEETRWRRLPSCREVRRGVRNVGNSSSRCQTLGTINAIDHRQKHAFLSVFKIIPPGSAHDGQGERVSSCLQGRISRDCISGVDGPSTRLIVPMPARTPVDTYSNNTNWREDAQYPESRASNPYLHNPPSTILHPQASGSVSEEYRALSPLPRSRPLTRNGRFRRIDAVVPPPSYSGTLDRRLDSVVPAPEWRRRVIAPPATLVQKKTTGGKEPSTAENHPPQRITSDSSHAIRCSTP